MNFALPAVSLFVLALASNAGSDPILLGQADFSLSCGGRGATGITSGLFTLRVAAAFPLLEQVVSDENEDELAGKTIVLTEEDGVAFLQSAQLLTDGNSDRVHRFVDFLGRGGCSASANENVVFDFFFACPDGIDFAGTTIDRIEVHLAKARFGEIPDPSLTYSLEIEATLSVYGDDPAPCVPPLFYADARGRQSLVPGAPDAARDAWELGFLVQEHQHERDLLSAVVVAFDREGLLAWRDGVGPLPPGAWVHVSRHSPAPITVPAPAGLELFACRGLLEPSRPLRWTEVLHHR